MDRTLRRVGRVANVHSDDDTVLGSFVPLVDRIGDAAGREGICSRGVRSVAIAAGHCDYHRFADLLLDLAA